MSKLGHMYNK